MSEEQYVGVEWTKEGGWTVSFGGPGWDVLSDRPSTMYPEGTTHWGQSSDLTPLNPATAPR